MQINTPNIESLLKKSLAWIAEQRDETLNGSSSDGGFINIKSGKNGERTQKHGDKLYDAIQIMNVIIPEQRRREGIFRRFLSEIENTEQYGMVWIGCVQNYDLAKHLKKRGYINKEMDWYKVIGSPIPSLLQEKIESELNTLLQNVNSQNLGIGSLRFARESVRKKP